MTTEQERRIQRETKKDKRRKEQIGTDRTYKIWNKLEERNIKVEAKFELNSLQLSTTIPSTNETISCLFRRGKSIVPRKVRLWGNDTWIGVPKGKTDPNIGEIAKDINGNRIVVNVALRTVFMTCTLGNGQIFETRAVCKPPDKWSIRTGIKFNLRHLFDLADFKKFMKDNSNNKIKSDYEYIIQAMMTKPPTRSKIKTAKKNREKMKEKRKKEKNKA